MHISWLETKWTDSQIRGETKKKERKKGRSTEKKSATLSCPRENLLKTLLFPFVLATNLTSSKHGKFTELLTEISAFLCPLLLIFCMAEVEKLSISSNTFKKMKRAALHPLFSRSPAAVRQISRESSSCPRPSPASAKLARECEWSQHRMKMCENGQGSWLCFILFRLRFDCWLNGVEVRRVFW